MRKQALHFFLPRLSDVGTITCRVTDVATVNLMSSKEGALSRISLSIERASP